MAKNVVWNSSWKFHWYYCKTLYFHCILISQFWNVEISLHFNFAFSQCSTSIYQAFEIQTEFSHMSSVMHMLNAVVILKFCHCRLHVSCVLIHLLLHFLLVVVIFWCRWNFGDGQTEFSRVFNFSTLFYFQNLQKFDCTRKNVFCSIFSRTTACTIFYSILSSPVAAGPVLTARLSSVHQCCLAWDEVSCSVQA